MNNSDSDLIPLPPPSQRVVPGLNIPLSYIQVSPRVVVELRGSLQPPPPSWPTAAQPDPDGERTWRVDFTNTTIYIRSQTPPNDPPGHWALPPTGEEIFVHQSLAKFDILYPTAVMPDASHPISSSGFEHESVLVLVSHSAVAGGEFSGRVCKLCRSNPYHLPTCPGILEAFCRSCTHKNGSHELSCTGFEP
ncbi:hypothetical protein FRC18_001610 [Serendipita sp. 400]|nr:hypothetical protein FRC18_001610 [Serendipita sp. 400]